MSRKMSFNEISRTDKHRTIIAPVCSVQGEFFEGAFTLPLRQPFRPVESTIIFLYVDADANAKIQNAARHERRRVWMRQANKRLHYTHHCNGTYCSFHQLYAALNRQKRRRSMRPFFIIHRNENEKESWATTSEEKNMKIKTKRNVDEFML